jgi:outer membrane protein TolC
MVRKWVLLLGVAWTLTAGSGTPQSSSPPGATPAQASPLRLTLEEAVNRGLRANLRTRVAEARVEEASGASERRFSALLPRVRAESAVALQNRSLRAFGLSFPGAPEVIPLFGTYDFRLYAEQPVFDRQLYHNWKASQAQERVTRNDAQDARDTVVRLVAALYLNAQSAAARVRAAESRVTAAEALLGLARDQREVGVATGVDVLRAQVQLSNEQQRRLEARNAHRQALIALARNIGLSPGTPIELAEELAFQPTEAPEAGEALAQAVAARADYRSLASQLAGLDAQHSANRARYYPKFGLGGDYGGIGRSFSGLRGTGTLQGRISMTLFDRDRKGEEAELDSRRKRLEAQLDDLKLGIEQEIREALLALDSAAQEVRVSQEGRKLAERELELARDRFQTGVTNNIEVVNAQDSLARALENEILAATRHADARMSLARALGEMEKNYARFAGATK